MSNRKILDFELATFYNGLKRRYAAGDPEGVEKYLKDCAKQLDRDQKPGLLTSVYNELGSFYRSVDKYPESVEAYSLAGDLIAERVGTESPEYAAVLNNMAGTCRMAGHTGRAIGLYEEAISVYKALRDTGSPACASVYNNLALACREAGQTQAAIDHLYEAAGHFEKLAGFGQETAFAYSNLMTLHEEAGDREGAMECLDRALAVFDTILDEKNNRYADALNSLAGFLFSEGYYERALRVYQTAADYTKRHFGRCVEYGITCQNMYWVYRRIGKLESAIIVLAKAGDVYARIFGADNERTRAVQDELARITGSLVV